MKLSRKLLFIPAVLVGVVVLVVAIKSRPSPELNPAASRSRLVELMPLEPQAIAPQVVGFGRVTPKVEWQGIAETSGRVVYKSPELEKGRLVEAGTVLVRIDPLDYELRLAQAEADLSSAQAQLKKLAQEEKNLKTQLSLEKQRLAISRQELKRKQDLRQRGLIAQSDVDSEQQAVLASQRTVQELETQLFVMPNERKVTEALVSVNTSRVDEAKRSLEKTEIVLPMDGRIADVNVEKDQVVNLQQVMMVAHGIDAVEIDAQIAIHDMAMLSASFGGVSASNPINTGVDQLDLAVTVTLSSGSQRYEWPATVSRISDSVSLNQATVGVILDVVQDFRQLDPTQAPPLVNGMLVEATLTGFKQPLITVPERAIHGNRIYLYREGKLAIEEVAILFRSQGLVAIRGNVVAGEQLVLNDLLPAVEGMALTPEESPSNGISSEDARLGDQSLDEADRQIEQEQSS
ncbi:efflux RND transporter periplasmic adaptor subunit [Thaumasiovibrio subtropicus]|uniref:efflux RND transporter periplasmic adaptor subunit n=1 Tax=Thaumasiovibrio subtropicus TaxID=1891207 RepID=UPI000B35A889|nr:biotin/lipoyl-binding protein [Thaumasiovibrio subtropicus]